MPHRAVDGWRFLPLGEVVSDVIDYRGRSPRKTNEGVPLVTARIVKGGRVLPAEEFISSADFEEWMRRGLPEAGDVVVTTEAPLGQVAQLDGRRVALAQRLILLRGKKNVLDNTYFRYAMQSPIVQEQLMSRATGTTVVGIRQTELRKILVPLPPFREQVSIAQVLRPLDDKFDVNRRMEGTLEEIAHTLFQSWFVDFDPVSGISTVPEEVRRLFPDRLVDSRLGPVPEGWEFGSLAELIMVSRESIDPRGHPLELFDHYSLPAFDVGRVPAREYGADIKSSKLQVADGCVLLSKLNPRIPRVWWPSSSGARRRIASTEFVVTLPRDYFTSSYLFGLFTSARFRSTFTSLVRGTSGSHQRVSVGDLLNIEVSIPPREIIERFDAIVTPMFAQREALTAESNTLAELRDTLLPKLLSGELRLSVSAGIEFPDRP